MNTFRSEFFLEDAERQVWFYLHESGLDIEAAVDLCQRFRMALEFTISAIQRNPQIGRRRLREYADIIEARSKIVSKPFQRFRIFYHLENNSIYLDRIIEAHTTQAENRD
jgi:hypothetical protein